MHWPKKRYIFFQQELEIKDMAPPVKGIIL